MSAKKSNLFVLEVCGLSAGYRNRAVISDISFTVSHSEIIAVIGPNGSGKSTLLKGIMGLNRVFSGSVLFLGRDITAIPSYRKVAQGIVYLPQGNRAFDDLTVKENLLMGGYTLLKADVKDRIDAALEMFPELKLSLNRPAYTLSGGERQMLAFARALILKPKLLLLDEPSIGLSPKLVKEVMEKITSIRDDLACSILVVEQKVKEVLGISDRVIGMRMGKIVFVGASAEALDSGQSIFVR